MAPTLLTVGAAPNKFVFWDESNKEMASPDAMHDPIAKMVMDRFRRARESKHGHKIFQGQSTMEMFRVAEYAMRKEYTPEVQALMMEAFGSCPRRYFGLSYAKVIGVRDWKTDLLTGNLEAAVRVAPTPVPRLDERSVRKIKAKVKTELMSLLSQGGVGDPSYLMDIQTNRLHHQVRAYLDERATALKVVEQARIVSAAQAQAGVIQTRIRDLVVEGGLRDKYEWFNQCQLTYGVGFMKWPHWERRVVLADKQDRKGKPERVWKVVPTFRVPHPRNMFPLNDGQSLSDCTAVCEYTEVSKVKVVGMMSDPRYKRDVIEYILTEYSTKSRSWLAPEANESRGENGEDATYWSPDEEVPLLIHQGLATGYDLHEAGATGYDQNTVYHIHCEILMGHTIRLEVRNPLVVAPRDYAAVKFDSLGDGVWNAVGVPALLRDTEERVNIQLRLYERNMDESARPPKMVNHSLFKNPAEARNVVPGGVYEVEEQLGGGGTPPDPIRAMRGAGAQYQIIWPLVLQAMRLADEEIGVPQLAMTGQDYGKGSLGEYSARITNALRRIKTAAYHEDKAMEPMWRRTFEHVIEEDPALIENADLDMDFQGISGILKQGQEDENKLKRLGLVMQGAQVGVVPEAVVHYAYQDALKSAGLPTEALGMNDPLITQALAIAAANPAPTSPSNQVPSLDGRSGAANAPGVVATPSGQSTALPNVV